MSDSITAKGSDAKFKPHPEGQYVGQCVDTIDLGEKVESGPDWPEKLTHKCVIVFRTGEKNDNGDFIDVSREFTVSMGEKANLRKFLEQWRGKPYAASQVEEGVPLHKLTGQQALLTISHKVSSNGRTYSNITACVGVPKQMADGARVYTDYKRADFWEERKKSYLEDARRFKSDNEHNPDDDGELPAAAGQDDDDLPF